MLTLYTRIGASWVDGRGLDQMDEWWVEPVDDAVTDPCGGEPADPLQASCSKHISQASSPPEPICWLAARIGRALLASRALFRWV